MNEHMTAHVGAKISEFRRKMATVRKEVASLPRKVVIQVESNIQETQRRLDRLADSLRTIQVIGRSMGMGSLLAVSPAMIPLLAGAVGVLGMLGAMVGVASGGLFALATAFGVAGLGALAFGSMAIPTITKLFEEGAKLNAQQRKAKQSWEVLASTWGRIRKALEPKILEAFTKSMDILHSVLHEIEPLFQGVANAVNRLLDSLKQSINTKSVQEFFRFLNANAGPMLERFGKAFGNIMLGLMNMAVAFEPLMKSISKGFEDMTKRFADWADGLKESKRFERFMEYVETNMPKIRSIFRDAIVGIVEFFTAFAPLSADMMTGLQNMMARFREWASTLRENPAFQNFIAYIRENGPAMLTFFGEFTRLITNIVKALAPVGEIMLNLTNRFLAWFNALIENNSTVQKLIGWLPVLLGGFKVLIPVIVALIPWIVSIGKAFKGFWNIGKRVWGWLNKTLLPVFTKIVLNIQKVLPWIARIGASFLRFATGPVGLLGTAIVGLATLIYKNWDKIKAWTRQLVDKITSFFRNFWTQLKIIVSNTVNGVVGFFKSMYDGVINIVTNVYNGVKNLFINMWNAVLKTMGNLFNSVKHVWGNVLTFLKSINLFEIGKNIIQGLIDGIKDMAKAAVNAVKGVVNDAIEGAKNLLGISSPSKVFHQYGNWVGEGLIDGLYEMVSPAKKASEDLAKAVLETARRAFEHSKQYIEQQVSLGRMPLYQQLKAWERVQKRYRKGTQERMEAERMIYDVKKRMTEKINQINEDYSRRVSEINQKLIQDERELRQEYQRTLQQRTQELRSFVGLFDKFEKNSDATGQGLLKNLRDQVEGFQHWQSTIANLAQRGIDKGLLAELRAMGPSALGEIQALNSLTDRQLNQYVALWQTKNKLARQQAKKELQGMKKDTEQKIRELRQVARQQLNHLEKEWVAKIKEVRYGTKNQLDLLTADMPTIGKNIAQGLIDGLTSMRGQLQETINDMARSINQGFQEVFGGSASFDLVDSSSGFTRISNLSNDMSETNSNTYNITVDAKNVKEFNDVVTMVEGIKQAKTSM